MKKLILLFSFVSFPIFAQINFETGYFINNNNVKTDCLIRNTDWINNPNKIEYKISNTENSNFYNISDIKEFAIENCCKYKRFKLKIDKTSSNINELSYDKNPIWSEETLFLKILIEGKTNLYEYANANILLFFISSGNHESVEQLVYKEYYKTDNEIGNNSHFRQQLLNALQSDNSNLNDFKTVKYKNKDLTNLVMKYNSTKETKPINLISQKKPFNINLKIITGINFTSFSVNQLYSDIKYTFDTQSILTAGLEAEFVLPIKKNKWTLFINPNYQSYQSTGKLEKDKNIEINDKYYDLDNRFIEIPVGIRHYLFLNNDFKIFINGGVTFSYSFNSTMSNPIREFIIYTQSFNKFIGLGLNINKYSAEIRYNTDRNLLREFGDFESKYTSIGILLGYKFL